MMKMQEIEMLLFKKLLEMVGQADKSNLAALRWEHGFVITNKLL